MVRINAVRTLDGATTQLRKSGSAAKKVLAKAIDADPFAKMENKAKLASYTSYCSGGVI